MNEKELLKTVQFYALATVNADGTPHNTPLFCMFNEDMSKIYWGSHPDSLHSKNIERTNEGFLVIYDSARFGLGGLYLTLKNAHCVTDSELPEALSVHNAKRAQINKRPLDISYYQAPNVQKMWVADIAKIEIYGAVRDENGHIYKEDRIEISAAELLNG
jgi:hypothetical protein